MRKTTVAEDKERNLGRSQIIKALGVMIRKSALPGGTRKPQGDCLSVMSLTLMTERGIFINVSAFPVKLREETGSEGFNILRLG